jgi:hypothetical protein
MRRRQTPTAVSVVEWRRGGHRLAYVAAIAKGADNRPIELITSRDVLDSGEFETHLAPFVEFGTMTVRVVDDLEDSRVLFSLLSELRAAGQGVVLPEADKFLPQLVVAKILRRLPRRMVIIVMRPPDAVTTGRRLGRWAKRAFIVSLMAWRRSLDVRLLEDPLGRGETRCWQGLVLGRPSYRLNDPCGVLDSESAPLPSSVTEVLADLRVVAVVGALDARKNLPLVIEGWETVNIPGSALLLAGPQSPGIDAWLRDNETRLPPNVFTWNNYLGHDELRSAIERSTAIITLYDGGISSSLMLGAAALGRWTITLAGTRTARVAQVHGFGIACEPTADDVGRAIREALAKSAYPHAVPLPDSREFGRDILRRFASPADVS